MGAGIIVVNEDNKILTLITHKGGYDLPKGSAEDGEYPFQTAQRECFEECNLWITVSDLLYETYLNRNGTQIFIAQMPHNQQIEIKVNEETGKAEHIGWCWITSEEFLTNTYPFLKTHIKWASNLISEVQKVKVKSFKTP